MSKKQGYYVYFYYSQVGELLYVGKTKNIYSRYLQHSDDPYFSKIETIGIRKYTSSHQMDLMETYYIQSLKPTYNKADILNDDYLLEIIDKVEERKVSKENFEKSRKKGGKSKRTKSELADNNTLLFDKTENEEGLKIALNILAEIILAVISNNVMIDDWHDINLIFDCDRIVERLKLPKQIILEGNQRTDDEEITIYEYIFKIASNLFTTTRNNPKYTEIELWLKKHYKIEINLSMLAETTMLKDHYLIYTINNSKKLVVLDLLKCLPVLVGHGFIDKPHNLKQKLIEIGKANIEDMIQNGLTFKPPLGLYDYSDMQNNPEGYWIIKPGDTKGLEPHIKSNRFHEYNGFDDDVTTFKKTQTKSLFYLWN